MNRLPDARIGSAPAQIAVHTSIDVLVAWMRVFGEQRSGGHDLAGLAIAALRDVDLSPGNLQRVLAVRRKPFDSSDAPVCGARGRRHTRSYGLTIQMNRASAALTDAAAVFRSMEVEYIPKHPEKRGLRGDIGGSRPPIHGELDRHNLSSNNTLVKVRLAVRFER